MLGSNTWLLAGLTLMLLLAGLSFRSGAMLLLSLPLGIFWLVGVYRMLGASKPQITVKRTLSETRVRQGDRVTVTLDVHYMGEKTDQLWIVDQVPRELEVCEGESSMVTEGRPGQTFSLKYDVIAPRGRHTWKQILVASQPHLSAAARHQNIQCESQLLSLPASELISEIKMRPRRTKVYAGLIPARRGGEGMEFFETREYAPGDSIRRIHWKASARTGRWITTQFEQERMADVAVILDARQKSNTHYDIGDESVNLPLFEHAVRAAASVADNALAQSNRVGLLVYGRALEWTFPGYGKQQRERISQTLAQARLGRKSVFEGLEYLPQRLFPVRSQIILISPLLKHDVKVLQRLHGQGYFVTVISPNPVQFEQRIMPNTASTRVAMRLANRDRLALINDLRRTGVYVVDWHTDQPLAPVIARLLPRRVR